MSFKEVCYVLLNYEIWNKDKKKHWGESVEALIMRRHSQNEKVGKKWKGEIKW